MHVSNKLSVVERTEMRERASSFVGIIPESNLEEANYPTSNINSTESYARLRAYGQGALGTYDMSVRPQLSAV